MGGRGASSGLGGGSGTKEKLFSIPKVTGALLKSMSRKKLVTMATAIYANDAVKRGLSQSEGVRRATLLMDGNTDAQLRKYISKHGKQYW